MQPKKNVNEENVDYKKRTKNNVDSKKNIYTDDPNTQWTKASIC